MECGCKWTALGEGDGNRMNTIDTGRGWGTGYISRSLILSQLSSLMSHRLAGFGNHEVDRISRRDLTFRARTERVTHLGAGALERQLRALDAVSQRHVANMAVEEGDEHGLGGAGCRVRQSLDAADGIVREDGALAMLVDARQDDSRVVGEEAAVVEVAGQQLSAQVHSHVRSVVEAVLVQVGLKQSSHLQNVSVETGIRHHDIVRARVNLVDLSVDDVDVAGGHSSVGGDDDEVVASNRASRSSLHRVRVPSLALDEFVAAPVGILLDVGERRLQRLHLAERIVLRVVLKRSHLKK
ncbi:hypothetical protein PFISCL1PPCAC_23185, partial [Pristionchus fissidentatus]